MRAAILGMIFAFLTACSGSPAGTADSGPAAAAHSVLCLSAGSSCAGANPVCCAHATTTSTCPDADMQDAGSIVSCSSRFTGFEGASCISSAADCTGDIALACDGPEDCDGGQVCCTGASSLSATCQASCPDLHAGVLAQLCHDHTQCPTDHPACCIIATSTGPAVSFGFCSTVAAESSIDFPVQCDMP